MLLVIRGAALRIALSFQYFREVRQEALQPQTFNPVRIMPKTLIMFGEFHGAALQQVSIADKYSTRTLEKQCCTMAFNTFIVI